MMSGGVSTVVWTISVTRYLSPRLVSNRIRCLGPACQVARVDKHTAHGGDDDSQCVKVAAAQSVEPYPIHSLLSQVVIACPAADVMSGTHKI